MQELSDGAWRAGDILIDALLVELPTVAVPVPDRAKARAELSRRRRGRRCLSDAGARYDRTGEGSRARRGFPLSAGLVMRNGCICFVPSQPTLPGQDAIRLVGGLPPYPASLGQSRHKVGRGSPVFWAASPALRMAPAALRPRWASIAAVLPSCSRP